MENIIELKIDRLVYGGDGVGKLTNGKAVFVPYVIPGELVRAKVVEEKAHFARAELLEILESSDGRIQPRCRHFTTCGGCHYQQMDYSTQLEAKVEILREQMERMGGFRDLPQIEAPPAAEPWYYRNHIQFHLTAEGKLGFQKRSSSQAFAIQECHLPEAAINHLWPQVEIEPIPSLARISMRQGVDEQLMIILESSSPVPLDFSIEDLPLSVVQVDPHGGLVLAGSDHLEMEILGKRFQVSAESFFQVNNVQARRLVENLLQELSPVESMTVLDVYAGVGLFSAFMAPRVQRLVAIEISAPACEDFSTNLDEFDNVELYEATADQVLNNVNFRPDAIIMDPPRAGLGPQAVRGLLAQGAETLAYISCDPATLARDGKQLATAGYHLERLALLDMFPQTYHIESMSIWKKNPE